MRSLIIKSLSFLLLSCLISACTSGEFNSSSMQKLRAGAIVSTTGINESRLNELFTYSTIPDSIWSEMQGKTYKDNPYIKREDLRYVKFLHHDFEGKVRVGEMICNKAIARDLSEIFYELYLNNYLIERAVLPDYYDADDEKQMQANNTSSFCYRPVAGTAVLSNHAKGMAVDINTLYNPYCKVRKDGTLYVQPSTATQYCDREASFSHKIDKNDLAYKLFTAHGFLWGGDWKSVKDYQHFEKAERVIKE
ncbi:MAG: M15 family metallopeptidase [Succinivibrio sp.]|nr:M15 family metallopeptidase [Succinivibrio sp.]